MKSSVVADLGMLLVIVLSPMVTLAQKTEPSKVDLPAVVVRSSKNEVPSPVKEAYQKDYGPNHKPFAWVNDNYVFQAAADKDMKITHYRLEQTASNGSSLNVSYFPDGTRINSREFLKNFTPSEPIMNALRDDEYEGWTVTRNITIRKVSNGGSEKERNYVTMKKGKAKKILVLDENGEFVNMRKNVFADAEQ